MKNCLLCGQPFSGKRKDALYCSGTCKAKYSELKRNRGLGGLQLSSAEQDSTEDKPSEKLPLANTVDAIDLEPFANIFDEFEQVHFNTTGLKQENNVVESNTTKQNKSEKSGEDEAVEQITLPKQYISKIEKQDNPTYKSYATASAYCQSDIKKCEAEIVRLNKLIAQEENNTGTGYLLAGAGLGFGVPLIHNYMRDKDSQPIEPNTIKDKNGKIISFLNNKNQRLKSSKKTASEKQSGFSFWEILLMGAIGTGAGYIGKSVTEANREAEKAKNIAIYKGMIAECQSLIKSLQISQSNIEKAMAGIPAFFEKEVQVLNPFYTIIKSKIDNENQEKAVAQKQQKSPIQSQVNQPENNQVEKETELGEINSANELKKTKNLETNKIFSMKKIAGLKHQLLNFTGKWLDFFGLPQTNFFCVIHGMGGEGKSHFAMQFGKYLAERFGNVLYISGEEGFASTFQQKIEALGASIERYYASEIKTGEELLQDVPNQYHFIIIDSLNNMGIDTELVRAIRAKYKQSGIIAICQSTKDGKIRGSYEIVHDSDMAVKVVNGIATTTKNRFKEKHQDFDVFAVYNKKNNTDLPLVKKKNEDKYLGEEFDNTVS